MTPRHLERGIRRLRLAIPHERWETARDRLHPALRGSIRRLASSVPDLGRVSVVVPCYKVEEYLADCLNSIITQTYPHLQIIVVIDGSPDRSAAIARGFARWDRRITVVEQPNGGLGNARNTGIAHATGDFIAFVDSDDSLPRGAYAAMVETLTLTGSDFVVGNLLRREGSKTWVPKWAQDVHREDRLRLTLDEAPEILADVFSWNKLFRRPFFETVVKGFPEGVRYEDQEPTARAYAGASAFDVLSAPVYTWYVRDDGSSITQQKSNTRDLQDRLQVMRAVSSFLARHASEYVVEHWHAKSIGLDLRAYYNEVPRTGDDFWVTLRDGVRGVASNMDTASWALVDLHDRVLARLVERDEREDVCTVLRIREEYGDGKLVDPTPFQPIGAPVYLRELQSALDPVDLVLSPQENRLTTGLMGYRVTGDDIEITGMAYVDGVDLEQHPSKLSARLVPEPGDALTNEPGQPSQLLPVRRTHIGAIDDVVNSACVSQAAAGFVATLSTTDLVRQLGSTADAEPWHVEVTLEVANKSYTSRFLQRDRRGSANVLEHGPLVLGSRPVPRFSEKRGLELRVRPARVVAEGARLEGRQLHLTLRTDPELHVTGVQAVCRSLNRSLRVPTISEAGTHLAALSLPPLPPGAAPLKEFVWQLRAITAEGDEPVDFVGGTSDLPQESAHAGGLRIAFAANGGLRLLDRRTHATVREISMDEWPEAFTARGNAALPPNQEFRIALASEADIWEPTDTTYDSLSGEYEVRFRVAGTRWGRDGLTYSTMGRSLRLLRHGGTTKDSLWVAASPGASDAVTSGLQWHAGTACDIRFSLTARARALWVNVRPPLGADEAGRRAQLKLELSIPSLLARPLHETVLFSCFGGRHAADSPLAIHQELEKRGYDGALVWAVADNSYALPPGARSVVIGSAAYYETLHTSRWLVNNNNFPHYFRKRADQRYLQTWHGTPLKRIGRDVPSKNLSLSYRALMEREVRAWDVLLAQNSFSATTLPEAFGYDGETLELGYPRNDLLAAPANAGRVAPIRAALGVRPDARLLLYAPTWRDSRRTANRGYALVNHLQLDRISKALGDTWTILVRGHSNTPGLAASETYDNVLDVSDYPDITELMLVADVLVTDYSSVMFDFVVTGKPMLFLVPDLEEYAGRTRGFYLDLAAIAPGPLLDSTDGVIAALTQPVSTSAADVERYGAFRDRFAPNDDGRAAERVVRAIWGAGH